MTSTSAVLSHVFLPALQLLWGLGHEDSPSWTSVLAEVPGGGALSDFTGFPHHYCIDFLPMRSLGGGPAKA